MTEIVAVMNTILNVFLWRLCVICQPGIGVLEGLFVVLEFLSKTFNTSKRASYEIRNIQDHLKKDCLQSLIFKNAYLFI